MTNLRHESTHFDVKASGLTSIQKGQAPCGTTGDHLRVTSTLRLVDCARCLWEQKEGHGFVAQFRQMGPPGSRWEDASPFAFHSQEEAQALVAVLDRTHGVSHAGVRHYEFQVILPTRTGLGYSVVGGSRS